MLTKTTLTLFVICLFSLFNAQAQYIIKGYVTDQEGAPLPGAKVYVEQSTYGVITNYEGHYFIELNKPGIQRIHFTFLGMQDTIIELNLKQKLTLFDLKMIEANNQLKSVEVVTKKVNVANGIIKQVQKNRKALAHQLENYTCNTYQKTGTSKEKRERLVNLSKADSTLDDGPVKMSLIESVSQTTFIAPNIYHEKIIAHHDYSDKSPTRTSSPIDYFRDDIITPVQAVEVDPYLFFEKVEDGDMNLYQNMINLPNITEHPITSPIGMQAFTNYKFRLLSIFKEDSTKIYEIEVTPRFKQAPLMRGSLFVIDSLWVIKSFNLSINQASMPFFADFNIIHDYENIDGYWVPVRREYTYTIKEPNHYILANTRVHHTNYQFNTAITEKELKNELLHYEPDAYDKDSSYWSRQRPIQLKQTELAFIKEQARIDSIRTSEHYLDSVETEFNRLKIGDFLFSGIGFRNRRKQQEIFINPVISGIQFFGVGGFRYKVSGHYSKKFDNAQQIKISPSLDYGFALKDFKGSLKAEYTFLPKQFGSIEVEAGNVYERLTNQINFIDYLFGIESRVNNQFFGIAHRREIINGLYGRVKFTYADRQPLGDVPLGPILQSVHDLYSLDTLYNFFLPQPEFERYQASLLELKLQYRFKQKYIIKNNEKLIIGTELPELELTFRQGIPRLLNSEVSFNAIELGASDEITLGNFGDSRWHFLSGSFLNKTDLRLVEHVFFKQSDGFLLSNPLYSHQTVDTALNTSGFYAEAFYVHHFNGFLLNKIPLINLLGFESIAGASFLYVEEHNYFRPELFFGVEKKFRFLGEYFKYGFYYVTGINSETNPYLSLKFGLDFFNTFTNKWSY